MQHLSATAQAPRSARRTIAGSGRALPVECLSDEILARYPVQDAGELVPGVVSASGARTTELVHKQPIALTRGLTGTAGGTAQIDARQQPVLRMLQHLAIQRRQVFAPLCWR